MKIRPANQDDIGPLMEIILRCIKNLVKNGIYQWDDIYPSRKDFQEDVLEQNLYVIIPAVRNDISGCICINEVEYPEYGKGKWEGHNFIVVHKMIIDPPYENLGFGKYAMNFAETFARSNNNDSIRLDCFQNNLRANQFYQGLGYVIRGETLFRKGMFNLYEKLI